MIENIISEWSREQWPTWQPNRLDTITKVLKDRENHLVLISEISGQIVGLLHLVFYLDILHGAFNGHLNLLLVKENYRSKGVGSSLLEEAAKEARRRNADEMHVDTMFEDAARFYRRHGFKNDGVWLELSFENAV